MIVSEKKRFMEALGTLAEIQRVKLSDLLLKTYWASLERYDIEVVENAISKAIDQLKFFPKPSELHELIGGNAEDQAEVESAKAFKAIRSVGSYESVCFDDPITQAVVAQYFGGWVKFCQETMESTEHFRKKEFVKMYASYKRSNMQHGGHLAGIIETQNNADLSIKNPDSIRYVGDMNKCKQVMKLKTGKEHVETGMIQIGDALKGIEFKPEK